MLSIKRSVLTKWEKHVERNFACPLVRCRPSKRIMDSCFDRLLEIHFLLIRSGMTNTQRHTSRMGTKIRYGFCWKQMRYRHRIAWRIDIQCPLPSVYFALFMSMSTWTCICFNFVEMIWMKINSIAVVIILCTANCMYWALIISYISERQYLGIGNQI